MVFFQCIGAKQQLFVSVKPVIFCFMTLLQVNWGMLGCAACNSTSVLWDYSAAWKDVWETCKAEQMERQLQTTLVYMLSIHHPLLTLKHQMILLFSFCYVNFGWIIMPLLLSSLIFQSHVSHLWRLLNL